MPSALVFQREREEARALLSALSVQKTMAKSFPVAILPYREGESLALLFFLV